MDLKCPSRLFDAADEPASLLIRRWVLGEVERIGMDALEAKRNGYTAMARAGCAV